MGRTGHTQELARADRIPRSFAGAPRFRLDSGHGQRAFEGAVATIGELSENFTLLLSGQMAYFGRPWQVLALGSSGRPPFPSENFTVALFQKKIHP
jgi:hypothetical protein